MLRILLTFILLVHGLIHLLGFVKEFGLAKVNELSDNSHDWPASVVWFAGSLWLVACLLFFVSAILFQTKTGWWWMVAAAAVTVSQVLIILYWQDAKYGSLVNGLLVLAIILSYGSWQFNAMVKKEVSPFVRQVNPTPQTVTLQMLEPLPPVIQKWLKNSGIVGKERIQTVHLQQKGLMRTKPNARWMPVTAQQYIVVDKPGFIWIADVKPAPFVHLSGRDKYEDGHGQMLIKLLSLFPVANAKGPHTDQGTLLRYLAETVWAPGAALSKYITWEQLDSMSAQATMTYCGVSASGIFTFNQQGDFIRFEARRYYDRKTGPTLENWLVEVEKQGYKEFEGIRVPAKTTVTWKLAQGDFTWFKLEITQMGYNKEQGYPNDVPALVLNKDTNYDSTSAPSADRHVVETK